MANHKWKKDVCIKCGITRTRKEYKKCVRTYSKLINGVFQDIPVYRYGTAWFYGMPHKEHPNTVKIIGFERPGCVKDHTNE